MKSNLLLSTTITILAISIAHAGEIGLSDQMLDEISGKNNTAAFASTNIDVSVDTGKNDVQVGFYQWDDDHSADSSSIKGGNTANGASSNVQRGVTAMNNIFGWGWANQIDTVAGGRIGNEFRNESWCAMFVGGY